MSDGSVIIVGGIRAIDDQAQMRELLVAFMTDTVCRRPQWWQRLGPHVLLHEGEVRRRRLPDELVCLLIGL